MPWASRCGTEVATRRWVHARAMVCGVGPQHSPIRNAVISGTRREAAIRLLPRRRGAETFASWSWPVREGGRSNASGSMSPADERPRGLPAVQITLMGPSRAREPFENAHIFGDGAVRLTPPLALALQPLSWILVYRSKGEALAHHGHFKPIRIPLGPHHVAPTKSTDITLASTRASSSMICRRFAKVSAVPVADV